MRLSKIASSWVLSMGCLSAACAGNSIHVVHDEGSTERQIAKQLQRDGVRVNVIDANRLGDTILLIDIAKDDKMPGVRLVVDTLVSKGEKSAPTGRVVMLRLLSRVVVPPEARDQALRVLNQHHQAVWAGCFYINDRDGEIEAQWPINVESDFSVPVAEVEDALRRLVMSWVQLYPKLMTAAHTPDGSKGQYARWP
jgi:hypothetical protein